MRITVDEIERTGAAALLAHGAGSWQAGEVARAIARAEETGNVICGLAYLESYCVQLRSGRVDGMADPEVSSPKPGVVQADARFGFAQPAFSRALPAALDAARACGMASLSVGHSHTCTSLGFFTERIAAEGLIALGFTNASAIVSGPGGRRPVLGTNPIAVTIPGPGRPAMHADFSTAAVALGKITAAKAAGDPIPEGWALDAEGQPTTDPEAALAGSLVSAGGYKGWALGLLVEILASGLTGSVNSVNVRGLKAEAGPPHDLGQFYILIDPGAHSASFSDRIGRLAEEIAKDPGVRIPGARPKDRDPVYVPDVLWQKAIALAQGGAATGA